MWCHCFLDFESARCLQPREASALESLSILAIWFGSLYGGGPLPVFLEGLDLADTLMSGAVAHLSGWAALGCSGNLKYFFFQSRLRRSGRTIFSLLQTSAAVSLFVQWLKVLPRILEMQAGLLSSLSPLWLWQRWCSFLSWEVQGCVGRGASVCASDVLLPRF